MWHDRVAEFVGFELQLVVADLVEFVVLGRLHFDVVCGVEEVCIVSSEF